MDENAVSSFKVFRNKPTSDRTKGERRKMSQKKETKVKSEVQETKTNEPETSKNGEEELPEFVDPTEEPVGEPVVVPGVLKIIGTPLYCPKGYRMDTPSGKCRRVM